MTSRRQSTARRPHANITASDVARRAGVSSMTVSRVINGEISVRQSTRDAVNQAIKELGYSPNKAARSLASAKQVRIGLMYSNPSSTFLSAMLIGLLEQARQSDSQVTVVEAAPGEKAIQALDGMVDNEIDGILLAPPLCDNRQLIERLKSLQIPVVTVAAKHEDSYVASVNVDDYEAARTMTRHLLALGHRRIGFIIGTPGQSASSLRLAGYRDELLKAGLDIDHELVMQGEFSYQSGFEAADKLLQLENAPTAIFASNDDMAAGAIATAYKHHLEVPGDLTVCGFDDTLLASSIWPRITTIRQPIAGMSNAAIELLEQMIRAYRSGEVLKKRRLEMDFELVERESDGPPPADKDN